MKATVANFGSGINFADLILTLWHLSILQTCNGFCASEHSLLDVGYIASINTSDVTPILLQKWVLILVHETTDSIPVYMITFITMFVPTYSVW